MDVYETLPDSTNDQESINILVECAKICMKQFAPEFSLSAESIEDNFDLQTLYLILEAAAGITKKEENKEEDIKNNVQESGTSWKTLDLASLESEAFLLGIWKDYQELEMSISMPELASLIQSKRKLDYEDRKFFAAIQGVDLDQANGEEDAWTKLKNKVFIVLEKDNSLTNKCINTLKTFSTFQEYYTISDYIVVIMNLLEAYQEDYRLFKLGKYSKFSNKAKEVILRFYSPTTKELELILNPTEKARKAGETYLNVILPDDAELFSKPTVKEETFILNNLIKLIE